MVVGNWELVSNWDTLVDKGNWYKVVIDNCRYSMFSQCFVVGSLSLYRTRLTFVYNKGIAW